jgi:quinoprotein glucose dehydrogenase
MKQFSVLLAVLLLFFFSACDSKKNDSARPYLSTWRVKGGNPHSTQYSSLKQITKENVSQLAVAWEYKSGEADTVNNRSQIQCNPIVVDGVLYATSPTLKAFALDAATGRELWNFQDTAARSGGLGVHRGVAY